VLINYAGIPRTRRFEHVSDDDLESLIATNLKSVFNVSGPALNVMREQG
jgi:NAD(P)-dependent dehydrogenase (short-subunit alcohol dehydrogenase family)